MNKILKTVAAILYFNSYETNASTADHLPTFCESDWQNVPSLPAFTCHDIMEMFVGPVLKDAKLWTLEGFNNDDFKDVIDDNEFELRTFYDESENIFHRPPFAVDGNNFVRFELFLVSKTKTYENNPNEDDDDDDDFMKIAHIPVARQLTEEEQNNPIIAYLRSSFTFEEQNNLHRTNPNAYLEFATSKAFKLAIFVKPEALEEYLLELNAYQQ